MLSYRHGFHAGNFADVLKHGIYCFTLAYLQQKDKPLYLLDTHAGAGAYDLTSDFALKTGEFREGIEKLLKVHPRESGIPDLWRDYLTRVAKLNEGGKTYPGSPVLAADMLREQDRLELADLHPTDYEALSERFARARRVKTFRQDGFALLKSRMPPPERRALVLIDPSYEVKTDYEAVVKALADAHKRFATGVYLLWYPVITRKATDALMAALRETGIPRQYRMEMCMSPDAPERGMTGTGMIIINPPYTLPGAAAEGLPWLAERLEAKGPMLSEWLVWE